MTHLVNFYSRVSAHDRVIDSRLIFSRYPFWWYEHVCVSNSVWVFWDRNHVKVVYAAALQYWCNGIHSKYYND